MIEIFSTERKRYEMWECRKWTRYETITENETLSNRKNPEFPDHVTTQTNEIKFLFSLFSPGIYI